MFPQRYALVVDSLLHRKNKNRRFAPGDLI
jgi:hypothetical protein